MEARNIRHSFIFEVLGFKPTALYILGKLSTSDPISVCPTPTALDLTSLPGCQVIQVPENSALIQPHPYSEWEGFSPHFQMGKLRPEN